MQFNPHNYQQQFNVVCDTCDKQFHRRPIDGDKRNNHPDNLMIFSSQSVHVKWHMKYDENWTGVGRSGM